MNAPLAHEAIAKAVKRRIMREAVIKDDRGFEALYAQLQQAMTNAWTDTMREGIASALDRLRDLGPGKFTKEDGAAILRVLEASVGSEAIQAAMRDPVIKLTDALYRMGAEEVGKAAGIAIAFNRPDLDALDVLKSGNLYWIGNSWNVNTQNKMAAILEDYFTEGMTREGLTARMAEDFGTLAERGRRYWEILADHTATKTRELGRVTGYERAGVAHVQVRAHMDERTTKICRHMHGRVIAVKRLRKQADAYLDAVSKRNEPAAKSAWVMHGADADLSDVPTGKLDDGTAGPPYHFQCRTITIAYFPPRDELAQIEQAIYDRAELTPDQLGHIEARAKDARWMDAKSEKRHWTKHGGRLKTRRMADYEGAARAVMDRPDTTMRVSMRIPGVTDGKSDGIPRPYAVFHAPEAHTPSGGGRRVPVDGTLLTAVRLDTNEITTHHWRDKGPESSNDIVPGRNVAGKLAKRIWKWLFSW